MTEIIFAVLFVSLMGLTRCYKTTVFLHLYCITVQCYRWRNVGGQCSVITCVDRYQSACKNCSDRCTLCLTAPSTGDAVPGTCWSYYSGEGRLWHHLLWREIVPCGRHTLAVFVTYYIHPFISVNSRSLQHSAEWLAGNYISKMNYFFCVMRAVIS